MDATRQSAGRWFLGLWLVLSLAGCSSEAKIRRTLRAVGPANLRATTLEVCRDGFATHASAKIETARWPEAVRAFHPLGLWAEADGAYLLLESDADGERGVYLPRILSDKDPLCGPKLQHVKLAEGVYTYDKKR